jgi:hypothetical protein
MVFDITPIFLFSFLVVVFNSIHSSLWIVLMSFRSIFNSSIPWPSKGPPCFLFYNILSNCLFMCLGNIVVIL